MERRVHRGAVDELTAYCRAGYCFWILSLGSVVFDSSQA